MKMSCCMQLCSPCPIDTCFFSNCLCRLICSLPLTACNYCSMLDLTVFSSQHPSILHLIRSSRLLLLSLALAAPSAGCSPPWRCHPGSPSKSDPSALQAAGHDQRWCSWFLRWLILCLASHLTISCVRSASLKESTRTLLVPQRSSGGWSWSVDSVLKCILSNFCFGNQMIWALFEAVLWGGRAGGQVQGGLHDDGHGDGAENEICLISTWSSTQCRWINSSSCTMRITWHLMEFKTKD